MQGNVGKVVRAAIGAATLALVVAGAAADEARDQSLAPPAQAGVEAQPDRDQLNPNQIEDQNQINQNDSGYDDRSNVPLTSEGEGSADAQEAPGRDEDLKTPDRAYSPDAVSSYRWGRHGGENIGIDLHENDHKIGVQAPSGPPPDARTTPPGEVIVQPPVDRQY